MVDLIDPRSNEPIVDQNGNPTRRFFEYITNNTSVTNTANTTNSVDMTSITEAANLFPIMEKIDCLESQMGIVKVEQKDDDVQVEFNYGILARLERLIEELNTQMNMAPVTALFHIKP